MNDDLISLYAFNRWANDRVVESIRGLMPEQYVQEPVPGWTSVRSSLVHIAGATWLWARRLRGEPVTKVVDENEVPILEDAVQLLAKGQDALETLLAAQTPESLAAIWNTVDPRGNERKMPYWSVYRHVANHATYHRGQIASKLKRFGMQAPTTDLIFWVVLQTGDSV
jgi:uncharacterized damage-inducible protein DinB